MRNILPEVAMLAGLLPALLALAVPAFGQPARPAPKTAASATVARVVDRPETARPNAYYHGNRPPLTPSTLIQLPFGSVRPQGWLRRQLELEAEGFTGRLTEISGYCRKEGNAWLSPEGIGHSFWEEVPYWLRGYAALGYVLGDKRIQAETQEFIEAAVASQTEYGYFGAQGNLLAPIHPPVPADLFTTADGKPGLTGEYFEGQDFKASRLVRVDPSMSLVWGSKPPAEGLPNENFSVRWTGYFTPNKTDTYTFSAFSDDGVRLWIDDTLLIDRWDVQVPITITSRRPIRLEAGRRYPVKIEYFQAGGGSEFHLTWKQPGAIYAPTVGSPDFMPNMSMLFALRANYEATGDKRILGLMSRYFRWQLSVPDNRFFTGGWQYPRNGDNMDSVYWLYNITGEPFLLDLTAKLMRTGHTWMSGKVTGGHNVDYSQGWRKPGQFYVQSRDPKHLAAAEGNYDSMHDIFGQVPGGMFGGDEFARPGHTDPQQAIETCGTVDMLLSQQIMLRATGDLKWADRMENAAFNSLPAHFTADLKALRYLTSPNQVNSDMRSKSPVLANSGPMQVMNPWDHRCCQHNSGMGWPYLAASLWHATPGNGLAAVMYAPSEVTARVGDGTQVRVVEATHYPFDDRVTLTVRTPKTVRFPIYLRVPGWCDAPRLAVNGKPVAVNGKPLPASARPQGFVLVDRAWRDGDVLAVVFPMPVRVRTWTANKDAVSVERGPLTFSVKIAEDYVRSGGTDKWPAWEIKPASAWNYGLVLDGDDPSASFEVVKKPWPSDGQPFAWDRAPVEIRARARRIANWQENYWGLVDALQPSPVRSDAPVETITLIPMGAGRLRVSALPVIGDGPGAHEWVAPPEPDASYVHEHFPLRHMTDGKEPKSSDDRDSTYMSFWPQNNGVQWVTRKFDEPLTVSSVEVYWYDDHERPGGGCAVPNAWKLYYQDEAGRWAPVTGASGFGVERDRYNVTTFDPVRTRALKIEATLGHWSGGIHEWRVK